MKTVPIQIPLTGEQWKQLDMISARQGFGPVEFVTNILLKELEKNQHLTRVAGKSKREYSHVPPCQIYQASWLNSPGSEQVALVADNKP